MIFIPSTTILILLRRRVLHFSFPSVNYRRCLDCISLSLYRIGPESTCIAPPPSPPLFCFRLGPFGIFALGTVGIPAIEVDSILLFKKLIVPSAFFCSGNSYATVILRPTHQHYPTEKIQQKVGIRDVVPSAIIPLNREIHSCAPSAGFSKCTLT